MLDEHVSIIGHNPVFFHIGSLSVTFYAYFMILAFASAILVYYLLARKEKRADEPTFLVAFAAIIGGVIGAKLPIWFYYAPQIIASFPDLSVLLSGRTITGGLIGGVIAVMIMKRWLGIRGRRGNLFAPAVALGIAVGRIGCFFAGCCFGSPTSLPWGVDFGDGILRHPTELYESAFLFLVFVYLLFRYKKAAPGLLFYQLMNLYFVFRFFEEFIRENPMWMGLSIYQWISIAALIFINVKWWLGNRRKGESHGN